MKQILFILLLSIHVISSQYNGLYDVFNLQGKGCENGTLNLNECGYFCNKMASIKFNYNDYYQISFFSDFFCRDLAYYENTNIPFIIPFYCNSNNNGLAGDDRVYCSNLLPKYDAFQFVKGPSFCQNDKYIPLDQCTSVCDSNVMINYDPFENYTLTFYSSNNCSEVINDEPISFYCNKESESIIKGENDKYKLSCNYINLNPQDSYSNSNSDSDSNSDSNSIFDLVSGSISGSGSDSGLFLDSYDLPSSSPKLIIYFGILLSTILLLILNN